jgi:hypothetical protein
VRELHFMQGDEFPANTILGNSEGTKAKGGLGIHAPALLLDLIVLSRAPPLHRWASRESRCERY